MERLPLPFGENRRCWIVAELSANHLQQYERALDLIDAAAEAGADAVKLQTYTPDTLTIDCDKPDFVIRQHPQWAGLTLHQLYAQAYTPWEWHQELKRYGEKLGLTVFSTPFDTTAVDFLEELDFPFYKVASFMTENLPLLEKIGKTKKPVIFSRGMTNLEDLELALKTLTDAGAPSIAILHCISGYPTRPQEMNLATIADLLERYGGVVGLSDHSLSLIPPVASVVLGAKIIEKHLTLSRQDGGPDAKFSLEPQEFKAMVLAVRETEAALGSPCYEVSPVEEASQIFKQSIYVVKDILEGEIFTEMNIRIIRPAYGLPPRYYKEVLGKQAAYPLERGDRLLWQAIREK